MDYIHPSISTTITDNSTTFVSAQGTTKLFAAFSSDIGEDNVVKEISSPSEFEFWYGKPDIKKHGQALYNIMNWLKANGSVYALRVMPENAGYSNCIINIQTKKIGVKSVENLNGDMVEIDNVAVRPTVSYTNVNNTSHEAILAELTRTDMAKTVDGYTNNFLMALYPKGRGVGYTLGFRMSITDELDSTFNFRVYNFEVTKTDENGTSILEGPFKVALEPKAKGISGESMFIESVLKTNSLYYNVVFNEDAYEKIAEAVNPNAHPETIDMISFESKKVNDEVEKVFIPELELDMDTNIYVQEYKNGSFTGLINMVDVSDEIESDIVDLDNGLRLNNYLSSVKAVENMIEAFDKVKKGTYSTFTNLLVGTTGELTVKHTELVDLLSVYNDAKDEFTTTQNAANQLALEQAIQTSYEKIKEFIALMFKGVDYSRLIATTPELIDLLVNIKVLESELFIYDIKRVKTASYVSKLVDVKEALEIANTEPDVSLKLEEVGNVIAFLDELVSYFDAVQTVEEIQADSQLASLKSLVNTVKTNYLDSTDLYSSQDDKDLALINAVNNSIAALDSSKTVADLIMVEIGCKTFEPLFTAADSNRVSVINAVSAAVTTVGSSTFAILKPSMEMNIELAKVAQDDAESLTYKLVLQDFNKYVRLLSGSDGDLSEENKALRDKTLDSLLVRAYTGLIDPEILNVKAYPIDVVMDSNYNTPVKNAIVEFVTKMRDDIFGIVDTSFTSSPEQAIDFRRNKMQVSDFRVALFTQDLIIDDAAYTGNHIKVTPTYFLASKIPNNDIDNGLHWNFVGPRRGTISGFEKLSWNPNEAWKEQLYKSKVNYIEKDNVSTKFGSQNTSQAMTSALSNINNVRTLLRIKREVEALMEDYLFEYNDDKTWEAAQSNLNDYLTKWISNRACDSISGEVYASKYDREQKILRVKIEVVFNSIIERIRIDISVNK